MPSVHNHIFIRLGGDFGDDKRVYNDFLGACHAAKARVVNIVSHSFHPEGFSAIALLSESHASIHTWPELRVAKLDYFSCSVDPCFDLFMGFFKEKGYVVDEYNVFYR